MHHTLRTTANLENLVAIRDFVCQAAAALAAPARLAEDLELAVDELIMNIIEHGYRGQPGEIDIQIKRQGAEIIVVIRDQAPPFDPTRLPIPDLSLPLEQRPIGGLGIFLARRQVDTMIYHRTRRGVNKLVLVKKIPPAHSEETSDGHNQ